MLKNTKFFGLLALCSLILSLIAVLPASAISNNPKSPGPTQQPVFTEDRMPINQLIVKYRQTSQARLAASDDLQIQRLSAAAGFALSYFRPMSGDAHVLRLPEAVPLGQAEEIAAQLATLPEVEYAEPDYWAFPAVSPQIPFTDTPDDSYFNSQWDFFNPGPGHYGVDAQGAWGITTGSSGVYVAVVDTGILDHADLAGRWTGGYDFITNTLVSNDGDGRDSDPHDPGDWTSNNYCYPGSPATNSSWHGTHVAGTIAALSNNSLGVAGLNWVSQVIPVRVLGKCGGYTSDIADGMRWAAGLSVSGVPANPHPVKVMNLSLSGSGSCGSTYQNAIDDIVNAGAVVVTAAGNSNTDAINTHPANCNNVITVAATNRDGSRSYYSNYGSIVEISAPGGESNRNITSGILSTLNSGTTSPAGDAYAFYQGTSMAAPHVTGIVSLLFSYNPTLTPSQVLQTLQNSATSFPTGSNCNTSICGSGIVNASHALQSLLPTLAQKTYLPFFVKNYPLEPGVIANGDFEQGTDNWIEYSSEYWDIIQSAASLPSGVTPHGGTYAAWMGGGNNEFAYLEQEVNISAATPYLEYYHWIDSSDVCGYDFASVRIDGIIAQIYDLCSSSNTGGWVRHTVNLSAYAGQIVSLQLRLDNDYSDSSSLFLDDINFSSSP